MNPVGLIVLFTLVVPAAKAEAIPDGVTNLEIAGFPETYAVDIPEGAMTRRIRKVPKASAVERFSLRQVAIRNLAWGDLVMPSRQFLVRSCEKKTARNNKPYLDLFLWGEGGTEAPPAKAWAEAIGEDLYPNDVIAATFSESEFDGKPQITVEKYLKLTDVPAEKFKSEPAVNQIRVFNKIYRYPFQNTNIATLFHNLQDYLERTPPSITDQRPLKYRLLEVPAGAKNHHARRAGLLQHIEEMWDLGIAICNNLPERFREMVNPEIVLAGVALHDLGKVLDYNPDTYTSDPSRTAILWEHTFWGAQLTLQLYPPVVTPQEQEIREKIVHCILAHHAKREHGAPVQPVLPEAHILSHLDWMSAQFDNYKTAYACTEKPPFNKTLDTVPLTPLWPKS